MKNAISNASFYRPTMLVSSIHNFNVKVGQWVQTETGSRGQYLGTTSEGALVIRWQTGGKFAMRDARANKPLRKFATIYGSK